MIPANITIFFFVLKSLLLRACMLSHFTWVQLCVTLWTDCSLPSSSVHGILQARILDWVSSRGSSWPRDQAHVSYVSCICRQVLCLCCHLGSPLNFSCVHVPSVLSDSAKQQTVAHWTLLSKEFSRQECWSGLPFPSPLNLSPVFKSLPAVINCLITKPLQILEVVLFLFFTVELWFWRWILF